MLFNVMLFNAVFNAMLMLLKKKNTNLDNNLFWRFYTQSRLSTGRGQQFIFAFFINETNIRYRWSMIRESANTTQNGIWCFSKELVTLFLRLRDAIWSQVSLVMLAV